MPAKQRPGAIHAHMHIGFTQDPSRGMTYLHHPRIGILASHSLVTVMTLCNGNAGCEVLFTKIGCTITHCGHTIMCSSKCIHTELWIIQLVSSMPPTTTPNTAVPHMAMAANIAAPSTACDHARFIHQALCSPLNPTLLQALA